MLAGENINVAYGFDCECIGDLWFDCDLWLWELLAEKCGAGVYWMLAVAVGERESNKTIIYLIWREKK